MFNPVIVKEVCACESPEVRSEEARAIKKSRGQRGTTYGDGAYLEIERGRREGPGESTHISERFILVLKQIGADRRDQALVAASRSEKAGMLILGNPLPIRITETREMMH